MWTAGFGPSFSFEKPLGSANQSAAHRFVGPSFLWPRPSDSSELPSSARHRRSRHHAVAVELLHGGREGGVPAWSLLRHLKSVQRWGITLDSCSLSAA